MNSNSIKKRRIIAGTIKKSDRISDLMRRNYETHGVIWKNDQKEREMFKIFASTKEEISEMFSCEEA